MNQTQRNKLVSDCSAIGNQVKSDKHLDSVYDYLNKKIITKNKIICKSKVGNKRYDLVFKNKTHFLNKFFANKTKDAIELKSISATSFAKNINNRIEEMAGQAYISKYINKIKSFSYVFVINETQSSMQSKHITRLTNCVDDLLKRKYIKNFVLIRVTKNGANIDSKFSFNNWNWN